jgi:hypothetical protein
MASDSAPVARDAPAAPPPAVPDTARHHTVRVTSVRRGHPAPHSLDPLPGGGPPPPGHWLRRSRPRPRPETVLGWSLAAIALALGVLLCALALAALVGVASLAGGPWRSVGEQVGGVVARSGQAAAAAGQAALDIFDPRHPPRDPLRLDTEFDALAVVPVGDALGASGESRLQLAAIAKRGDARDDATAQYAVVRRELLTPQPRRVLGVPLGEDRGQHEHYLYKGQSYRLGGHYYKVNWVSVDRQQVAVARYRTADGTLGPLAFEYD